MFCCSFQFMCSNHSMWSFVVHGDIPPSLMILFYKYKFSLKYFCIVSSNKKVSLDITVALMLDKLRWVGRRQHWTFSETERKYERVAQNPELEMKSHEKIVSRVQTASKAGLDACHHTCLLQARIQRHKRANLFMAPHHSRYGPRAVLHRSSVDCEIWFHEGIDKIWGPMNTEYHFCRLQPLWTNYLRTRRMSQCFGAINLGKMVQYADISCCRIRSGCDGILYCLNQSTKLWQ